MILLWMIEVSRFTKTFNVGIPCPGLIRTPVSGLHAPSARTHSKKIQKEPSPLTSRRPRRRFHFAHRGTSRDINIPASLLFFLLAFVLPSCAGIDQSIEKLNAYLPDIEMEDFTTGGDPSDKKERLANLITPLKETKIIFSPIISLTDLNKEGAQKNKFFLAGEIYSKNPEESVSSLSSDNCYSPRDQGSIKKMERLYHVFIKDLGLDSANANELDGSDNINPHFLIQPVLLKFQYCKRANVEIRYLIQNNTGKQTARTIKTSHKAKNFKFPEREEYHPFFNYDHPETQFPGLRHALTMAFYKNTMDLVKMVLEEYNENKTN